MTKQVDSARSRPDLLALEINQEIIEAGDLLLSEAPDAALEHLVA